MLSVVFILIISLVVTSSFVSSEELKGGAVDEDLVYSSLSTSPASSSGSSGGGGGSVTNVYNTYVTEDTDNEEDSQSETNNLYIGAYIYLYEKGGDYF